MPAFEIRAVRSIEDLPSQLVSFGLRTSDFASQPANLSAEEVLNRAAGSLRSFGGGDNVHAPWANAKKHGVSVPVRDAAAFDGSGGLVFSAANQVLGLSEDDGFPAVAAGGYTLAVVSDFTPSTHGQIFYNAQVPFSFTLGDGTSKIGWTDSGGSHSTGTAMPGGKSILVANFAPPTAAVFVNGALFAAAAYANTALGGVGTNTLFGGDGTTYLDGKLGYFGLWNRNLSGLELDYVSVVAGAHFGLAGYITTGGAFVYGMSNYVAPTVVPWLDPANGTISSRINSVVGNPQTRLEYKRPLYLDEIHALVLPILPSGALDASTDFVASFIEWPLDAIEGEPRIIQDSTFSGVCRLTLKKVGHYLFQLRRPGGGAYNLHFDVGIA